MEPFFTAEHRFPTISLALEDILPRDTTSPRVQARAVYQYYVTTLAARPSDEDLRPFREKALMGPLTPPDYATMHTLFTTMKSQAQDAGTRRPRQHTLAAYASLNSYAMLLAQILFVDNSLKEGLLERIEEAPRDSGARRSLRRDSGPLGRERGGARPRGRPLLCHAVPLANGVRSAVRAR